jgi:hypothetical protein
MRIHRTLSLTVIAIASAGAYLTATGHQQQMPELTSTTAATSQYAEPVAGVVHARDHDDVALQDMTLHAFRHLDDVVEVQQMPGLCRDWTPSWELRWLDFQDDDGDVTRVYHATSRHHPGVRFTVDEGRSDAQEWERAR